MSSVSWYFFMSPLTLCLHLFFGRPRLRLPETSSFSDFAQMCLLFRLKQWPYHFSLLFSRNVATGFTCASFLMSSFRMWSNLVFPLAHLNILISAELSLFSSFFYCQNKLAKPNKYCFIPKERGTFLLSNCIKHHAM